MRFLKQLIQPYSEANKRADAEKRERARQAEARKLRDNAHKLQRRANRYMLVGGIVLLPFFFVLFFGSLLIYPHTYELNSPGGWALLKFSEKAFGDSYEAQDGQATITSVAANSDWNRGKPFQLLTHTRTSRTHPGRGWEPMTMSIKLPEDADLYGQSIRVTASMTPTYATTVDSKHWTWSRRHLQEDFTVKVATREEVVKKPQYEFVFKLCLGSGAIGFALLAYGGWLDERLKKKNTKANEKGVTEPA